LGTGDDREDEHDGCEPDVDDEPSLGSVAEDERNDQSEWARGSDHDLEYDGADDEPSLGWPEGHIAQIVTGDTADREADRADDEPSLGWTVDGCVSNTEACACDLEQGGHAVQPQNRTEIDRHIHRDFRRTMDGLTPEQRKAFRDKMRP
jgi:hypothetical protein